MGSAVITKSVVHLFNLLNGGNLKKIYQTVKAANEQHLPINQKELQSYLCRWGFKKVLEDNPIMNKNDVRKWIEKEPLNHVKEWAYTGGSFGEPLRIPYSKRRSLIRTATFTYFNEIGGYSIGDPFIIIRAKKKSKFVKFLRNELIFIPHDISNKKLQELVKKIKSKNVKILMGYPTVIYELALYLQKNNKENNELPIRSIITVSEPLEEVKRKVIYETFNCRYVDRYSNEEVGLIAQQKEFGGEYFVNKAGIITEVVNLNTNYPVQEGEVGKVLVTDINNDLIPLIRYDTGDLAVVEKYKDGQLLSIKEIVGRTSQQIFTTSGSPVSPLILGPHIYKPLANAKLIEQYQFAQVGKNIYELRIKNVKNNITKLTENKLIAGLVSVLGEEANIKILNVEEIKPLPSGKRPIYVNEFRHI